MRTALTRESAFLAASLAITAVMLGSVSALADNNISDFESPAYAPGNINGQDGWTKTGAFDAEVVDLASPLPSPAAFGDQSLRISNAVTSGSFGDQTFAKPLTNAAGEVDSTNGSFSPGTLQNHFEAEFDILPTTTGEQPGLFLSVSPDRGDGSRMSYLGFDDTPAGIDVLFYDVQGTGNPASFVLTNLGTLNRTEPHSIRFVIDFVDGPSNDVVKVYIDGVLKHTGTTWENYYRYDSESAAEQSPRIVKTLLFRAGGTAAPATAGNGFLIDNVELSSSIPLPSPSPTPENYTVTIHKYLDGAPATAASADNADFPMHAVFPGGEGDYALSETGFNGDPTPYRAITAEMPEGSDYSTYEKTDGEVVGESCDDDTPFALVGYTTGTSLAAAENATPTTAKPEFDDLNADQFVIVWNKTCEEEPVDTVQVHILKYLNGSKASTVTGSYLFPMTATWNAENGSGTGEYVLGNNQGGAPDQYGAVTSEMSAPADYTTAEVTDGTSQVLPTDAQCQPGKFRLQGYSVSDIDFANAAQQPKITTAPIFTDLTTDRFVIVWNEECPQNSCDRERIEALRDALRQAHRDFFDDSREIIRELMKPNLTRAQRQALIEELKEIQKTYHEQVKELTKELKAEEKQCRGKHGHGHAWGNN